MIAFSRIATFLLFVLSLSFLTCAASTSGQTQGLAVRGKECDTVLNALVGLKTKLNAYLDACADVNVLADAQVKLVTPIVHDVKACTDAVVAVGAIANVEAKAKADIVVCITAIISLIIQILIKVSAKLSVSVMASICAEIDVCLKALLVALNVCISGIVGLALKAIVDLTVIVFIKAKLVLCADILGLVKVAL